MPGPYPFLVVTDPDSHLAADARRVLVVDAHEHAVQAGVADAHRLSGARRRRRSVAQGAALDGHPDALLAALDGIQRTVVGGRHVPDEADAMPEAHALGGHTQADAHRR